MRRAIPLVTLLCAAACYTTPTQRCAFVCGPDDACPSGYQCGNDSQCHLLIRGVPAMCEPLPVPDAAVVVEIDAALPDAPVEEPDAEPPPPDAEPPPPDTRPADAQVADAA